MISKRAKYALRALVALARAETGSMTIVEIAASQKIPRKFLEQILLQLKKKGILASRRGKLGGYALGKPAEKITFGEVLRIVDGPIAPLPCLSKFYYRRCSDCLDEGTCEVRRVFFGVAESARAVLDRTTLADAVANPG
jgi:Rrf2 family protein